MLGTFPLPACHQHPGTTVDHASSHAPVHACATALHRVMTALTGVHARSSSSMTTPTTSGRACSSWACTCWVTGIRPSCPSWSTTCAISAASAGGALRCGAGVCLSGAQQRQQEGTGCPCRVACCVCCQQLHSLHVVFAWLKYVPHVTLQEWHDNSHWGALRVVA